MSFFRFQPFFSTKFIYYYFFFFLLLPSICYSHSCWRVELKKIILTVYGYTRCDNLIPGVYPMKAKFVYLVCIDWWHLQNNPFMKLNFSCVCLGNTKMRSALFYLHFSSNKLSHLHQNTFYLSFRGWINSPSPFCFN